MDLDEFIFIAESEREYEQSRRRSEESTDDNE